MPAFFFRSISANQYETINTRPDQLELHCHPLRVGANQPTNPKRRCSKRKNNKLAWFLWWGTIFVDVYFSEKNTMLKLNTYPRASIPELIIRECWPQKIIWLVGNLPAWPWVLLLIRQQLKIELRNERHLYPGIVQSSFNRAYWIIRFNPLTQMMWFPASNYIPKLTQLISCWKSPSSKSKQKSDLPGPTKKQMHTLVQKPDLSLNFGWFLWRYI